MMNHYIKFENGVSKGHPSTLENLQQIYPNFLENYQSLGYYPIEIVKPPVLSGFLPTQINYVQYQLEEDGTASMYYITRKMTQQEKQNKYNDMITIGFREKGWILNPETLVWEPPFMPPPDGQDYIWNSETESWIVNPISPEPLDPTE